MTKSPGGSPRLTWSASRSTLVLGVGQTPELILDLHPAGTQVFEYVRSDALALRRERQQHVPGVHAWGAHRAAHRERQLDHLLDPRRRDDPYDPRDPRAADGVRNRLAHLGFLHVKRGEYACRMK